MRKQHIPFFVSLLILAASLHGREWTSSNGKAFNGTLVQMSKTKAFIRANDSGKVYEINISTLSSKDQEFIKSSYDALAAKIESLKKAFPPILTRKEKIKESGGGATIKKGKKKKDEKGKKKKDIKPKDREVSVSCQKIHEKYERSVNRFSVVGLAASLEWLNKDLQKDIKWLRASSEGEQYHALVSRVSLEWINNDFKGYLSKWEALAKGNWGQAGKSDQKKKKNKK